LILGNKSSILTSMKGDAFESDDRLLARFGERLAAQRVARELTQAQLARAAGVSKRTVERLEGGESAQVRSLLRVLRVLGLLEGLEALVPAPLASPLERLREEQQAERARPRRVRAKPEPERGSEWTWGDEA
jgi:transcriptional regulator with XRE-family HTH domain